MAVETLSRISTNASSPIIPVKDACNICAKTVYPMDRLNADDKIFHKTCLRCGHCKKVLSLGNYASLNSIFYCKPHYKQLFAVKGNYSDGFKNAEAAAIEEMSPALSTPQSASTYINESPVSAQPEGLRLMRQPSSALAERMAAFNFPNDDAASIDLKSPRTPRSKTVSSHAPASVPNSDKGPLADAAGDETTKNLIAETIENDTTALQQASPDAESTASDAGASPLGGFVERKISSAQKDKAESTSGLSNSTEEALLQEIASLKKQLQAALKINEACTCQSQKSINASGEHQSAP